jgi:hypothetical protein
MFIGMVNSSDVWDARHDIYWFATAEVITVHGALVLTSLFLIFKTWSQRSGDPQYLW